MPSSRLPTKEDLKLIIGSIFVVGLASTLLSTIVPERHHQTLFIIATVVCLLNISIVQAFKIGGTSLSDFIANKGKRRADKSIQDEDDSKFSIPGPHPVLPGEISREPDVLFSNTDRDRRHTADMGFIFNPRYMRRDPRLLVSELSGVATYQLVRGKNTPKIVLDIFGAVEALKKPDSSAEPSIDPNTIFALSIFVPPIFILLSQFMPQPISLFVFFASVLGVICGCVYYLRHISAQLSGPKQNPQPKPLCIEYDQSSPTLIGSQENLSLLGKAMFKNNSKIHVKQSPYILQNEQAMPFSLNSSAVHCNFNVWQLDVWCGKLIFLPDCLAHFSKDDDFLQSFKYSELKTDRGTTMNNADFGQSMARDTVTHYLTVYCEERNFQFSLVSQSAEIIDEAQALLQRVLFMKTTRFH